MFGFRVKIFSYATVSANFFVTSQERKLLERFNSFTIMTPSEIRRLSKASTVREFQLRDNFNFVRISISRDSFDYARVSTLREYQFIESFNFTGVSIQRTAALSEIV